MLLLVVWFASACDSGAELTAPQPRTAPRWVVTDPSPIPDMTPEQYHRLDLLASYYQSGDPDCIMAADEFSTTARYLVTSLRTIVVTG